MLHGAGAGGVAPEAAAQAVAEGTVLGLYRFDAHKTELEPADRHQIEEVTVLVPSADQREAVERGVKTGQTIAAAAWLARDLINQPSNVLTPTALADLAAGIAHRNGLRADVLGPAQMEALGMGALLAVAQGSRRAALHYS